MNEEKLERTSRNSCVLNRPIITSALVLVFGFSAWVEIQATEPIPEITEISITASNLSLTVSNMATGGTYTIERAVGLVSTNWPEVDSFEGIQGMTNWTDSLGVTTSAFYRVVRDPYHPKVGEVATFTDYHHGIAGTAHIVNNRTIELRNFDYDGGGPAVVVSVDSYPLPVSPAPWGTAISGYIGGFSGSPPTYVNTNLTFTLPDGFDLGDVNYISIWCEDFKIDFGSGMFQ
jgi:hypothetical protein